MRRPLKPRRPTRRYTDRQSDIAAWYAVSHAYSTDRAELGRLYDAKLAELRRREVVA